MDKKIIVSLVTVLILCIIVVSILSIYGVGNLITGSAITGISRSGECTSGQTRPCGSNVGLCKAGVRYCSKGIWGNCIDGVGPEDEKCNGIDDDCDGFADDGNVCFIANFNRELQPKYSNPLLQPEFQETVEEHAKRMENYRIYRLSLLS